MTVNTLHPGIVNTEFAKNENNDDLLTNFYATVAPILARSPEAETSIYLASSSEVQGITGKYFSDSKIAPTASQAKDAIVAKKLWDVSAAMIHLADVSPDMVSSHVRSLQSSDI